MRVRHYLEQFRIVNAIWCRLEVPATRTSGNCGTIGRKCNGSRKLANLLRHRILRPADFAGVCFVGRDRCPERLQVRSSLEIEIWRIQAKREVSFASGVCDWEKSGRGDHSQNEIRLLENGPPPGDVLLTLSSADWNQSDLQRWHTSPTVLF
jgi:hypothetical protein